MLAENQVCITAGILLPDAISTVRADAGVFFQAVRAERYIIKVSAFLHGVFFVAAGTDKGFIYIVYPPDFYSLDVSGDISRR